jgi:hypothetical protein
VVSEGQHVDRSRAKRRKFGYEKEVEERERRRRRIEKTRFAGSRCRLKERAAGREEALKGRELRKSGRRIGCGCEIRSGMRWTKREGGQRLKKRRRRDRRREREC